MEIRHGFLYLADLNPRFGSETGKTRPVFVVQSDLLNEVEHASTWILPCTTKLVGENILRVHLPEGMGGNSEACEIMIDQSRAIDNRRFKKKLKALPSTIVREIKEKLRLLAEIT